MPTSAHRMRAASNTGPSTHERTKRDFPSSPRTGSTQVMHTPIPQAIASSTATWAWIACLRATSPTARSIGIGPQA